MPIPRQEITGSSMIGSVGYDAAAFVMEVEFKTNGSVYRLEGVPPSAYEGLMGADSAGQYYNAFIKGQYPTQRIE